MGEVFLKLLVWFVVASLRWLLALGKKPFSTFLDHDIEGTTVALALGVGLVVIGVKLLHKVF